MTVTPRTAKAKAKPKKRIVKKQKMSADDMKAAAYAREYFFDRNFTQAGIRMGLSPKTAGNTNTVAGFRGNPYFISTLRELENKRLKEQEAKKPEVVDALLRALRIDIRRLFDEEGKMLKPNEWPKDVALCVNSVIIDKKNDKVTIKMQDKNAVIDKLMRHMGMYQADNEQKLDATAELLSLISAGQGQPLPATPREVAVSEPDTSSTTH